MRRAGGELGRLAQYERADGRAAEWQHRALCQRKARRAPATYTRLCAHTNTRETKAHRNAITRAGTKKKAQTKSNAHTAETIIMPSEIA